MGDLEFVRHQVDILYDSDPNPICVGTLISSYLVLTVYSCLIGKNETKLKVRNFPRDASEDRQTRYVDTIHSYPARNSKASEQNDIAVILLDSDFSLDQFLDSKFPIINFLDIIQYYTERRPELTALSPPSLPYPYCGNISVEETEDLDCWQDKPNSICVEKVEQYDPCPRFDPVIGSGLVCKTEAGVFLCGALAEKNGNEWVYTDISKYFHWIRLTFEMSTDDKNGDGDNDDDGDGSTNEESEPSSIKVVHSSSISYQLDLEKWDDEDRRWKRICCAVIIDSKRALTAASCFNGENFQSKNYQVVSGTKVSQSQGQIQIHSLESPTPPKSGLGVQKVVFNPGFNKYKRMAGGDIAIIHIKGSFDYSGNAQYPWIPRPVGANHTDPSARLSDSGEMGILANSECKKSMPFITPSMMCTYPNVSNTCETDSGCPFVVKHKQFDRNTTRNVLIGIQAFASEDCKNSKEPNVYIKVSHFYDWIKENQKMRCNSKEFKCLNGNCIDECSVCNDFDDCGDNSDEKHCEESHISDIKKTVFCLRKNQNKLKKEIEFRNRNLIGVSVGNE